MKATIFKQHGGPEVIRYEDVPEPAVRAGQVLVRVKACALNHLDLWIRQGIPAFAVQLPHIGGCDVAGVVERVASDVDGITAGTRILIAPGLSCWRCEFCLSGRDNVCISYAILGAQVNGGMAEFVSVPAVNILPISPSLSFEQAAAFPLTAVTVWHMLFGLAELEPAQDVLVLGAGSGVGSMAVQMAVPTVEAMTAPRSETPAVATVNDTPTTPINVSIPPKFSQVRLRSESWMVLIQNSESLNESNAVLPRRTSPASARSTGPCSTG